MTQRLWSTGIVLTLLGGLTAGLGAPSTAPADDKAPANPAAAKAAEDVRNIALANELAEYGRKHKAADSLVTAARILRQIRTTPGTEKVAVTEGKEEPDTSTEAPTLLDRSDELLKEARNMAPDDSLLGQLI